MIADSRIKSDLSLIAIKCGTLIFNVETVDNVNINRKLSDSPLWPEWRPDLLGGVLVITGKWQVGAPMLAIPNFVRTSRVGQPPRISRRRRRRSYTRIQASN